MGRLISNFQYKVMEEEGNFQIKQKVCNILFKMKYSDRYSLY